jgi:hypothetical protein
MPWANPEDSYVEINSDFALGYKFFCPWRTFSAACSHTVYPNTPRIL